MEGGYELDTSVNMAHDLLKRKGLDLEIPDMVQVSAAFQLYLVNCRLTGSSNGLYRPLESDPLPKEFVDKRTNLVL